MPVSQVKEWKALTLPWKNISSSRKKKLVSVVRCITGKLLCMVRFGMMCSTCLIYGHSLVDCPKDYPKQVVNGMDKGKGQESRADDEGFIEVKKKKLVGKKHGRMMLDSIDNGPLVYPTVEENRQTRPKKYSELTEAQQLQDDCDVQATNIILHGLPPDGETLRERYPDSLAFVANSPTLYNPSQSPRNLGYSMYLPPQQFTPVYGAPIHHQHHRTPINPTLVSLFLCFSKEMIRLIAQQSILHVVARSIKSYAGTGNRGIATTSKGNVRVGPQRVMKCYNCQGEGHMVRQCTQPKRPRMLHGFKEKLMLIEAQERNLAFQPDDLDAYDSNCDDLSSTKAILMENLSSCDLEVLSEGGVVSLKWGIDGGWGGGDPVRGSLVGDKGEMSVIGFAVFVFKGVKFRRLIGVGVQNYVHVALGMFKLDIEPISPSLEETIRNAKFEYMCAICNKCLFDDNHDMFLVDFVNDVNVRLKSKSKINKKSKAWKPTSKVFTDKIVHLKETTPKSAETSKPEIKVYSRRPNKIKSVGLSKKAKIVESKIANNSEPTHLWGSNTDVPSSSSLVNDSPVYYVEGLRHNLFSVRQFCDADLKVAFQKNTCFIRNLEGVDLLSGSRDTNLYIISLDDMLKNSMICLLSKASKTNSWYLQSLHFREKEKIIVVQLCILGKSKRIFSSNPSFWTTNPGEEEKTISFTYGSLWPMHVESINGKNSFAMHCQFFIKVFEHIMERNLSTRLFVISMKMSAFHIKLQLLALLNKMALSKDETKLLRKLPATRRTRNVIETIHVTFDELTSMASKQNGSRPGLQVMTPATSSSGLVPNNLPQQPFPVAVAPKAVEIADSPVSTSIDQDAPSLSIPSTQDQEHSLIISQGVEESLKTPLFHDDPLHEFLHEDSTSQGSSSSETIPHSI
ncbi:integrase, catalytic region, zinc finger, CCHC-type containing protein [Tanacetum coccineum]